MELLEFITKIVHTNTLTEADRYWRLMIKCFLVDRFDKVQLSSLPDYFKKCYGQYSTFSGKLSTLVQEPEFKAICYCETTQSIIWIKPSGFLLQILRAQLSDPDQQGLKIHSPSGMNDNYSANNMPISTEKSYVDKNPFALDAMKEIQGSDRNPDTKFGRLASEELTCGICFELLKDAVEGNCCKNLFCAPCIEGYGRKCPNCRKVVEWTANEPIRRLIRKKPIQCEYEQCGIWSTISEIEQHRVKCEFNPNSLLVTCQKCQQLILRKLMDQHLSNVCEMNTVPCFACGVVVVKKDLAEHATKFCEYRMVSCGNGCGEQMTYKQFNEVHLNSCSHQLVKCSHKNCPARVEMRHLADHSRECKFVEVECSNSKQGCKSKPHRGALQLHVAKCDYQLVKCQYGCDQELLRRDTKQHTCSYMSVKCPNCSKELKKKDLEQHKDEECPAQQVKCLNKCGTSVLKKRLPQHIESACTRRQVPCPQCQVSVVFASLAKHVSKSCPHRPVVCVMCGASVAASSLASHETTDCPLRIVSCAACDQKVSANAYADHRKSIWCNKSPQTCFGCKEEFGSFEQLTEHASKCSQQRGKCPMCDLELLLSDLPSHKEVCSKRPVECPHCTAAYTANTITRHAEKCVMRPVQCPDCKRTMAALIRVNHVC